MKIAILMLLLIQPIIASCQVYIDIFTAPMMLANAPIIRGEMKKTNDNLGSIQRGQLYIQTQLGLANDLQRKILKGLQEVSGTVRNAITIRQIYDTSTDVIEEMQDAVRLASDHPQFTIFAYRSANIFRSRALELYSEVSAILKQEETNLLSAGERQQLLLRIYRDVKLLWGAAYGINYAMKTAIRAGFWHTLNPFKVWVNRDARIMRDIMRNARQLTKRK